MATPFDQFVRPTPETRITGPALKTPSKTIEPSVHIPLGGVLERENIVILIYKGELRTIARTDTTFYRWRRPTPIAIHVKNELDVPITIRFFSLPEKDANLPGAPPVVEMDCGPMSHQHGTINPNLGDTWGIWFYGQIFAQSQPMMGDLTVELIGEEETL